VSGPKPSIFKAFNLVPLTNLELDELCAVCEKPRRDHRMPRYDFSNEALLCCTPPGRHFEPTGRHTTIHPKLAQLRALRAAEAAGWRPVWEVVLDQVGKQVGQRIVNDREMRKVGKGE